MTPHLRLSTQLFPALVIHKSLSYPEETYQLTNGFQSQLSHQIKMSEQISRPRLIQQHKIYEYVCDNNYTFLPFQIVYIYSYSRTAHQACFSLHLATKVTKEN